MTTVTIPELKQRLYELNKEIVPRMKETFDSRICPRVEAKAKENCTPGMSPYWKAPFDTGLLRASITTDAYVSENLVIATLSNPLDYASFVHDGTSRMPPRPFLLDAVIDSRDQTWQDIADTLGVILKEATK